MTREKHKLLADIELAMKRAIKGDMHNDDFALIAAAYLTDLLPLIGELDAEVIKLRNENDHLRSTLDEYERERLEGPFH